MKVAFGSSLGLLFIPNSHEDFDKEKKFNKCPFFDFLLLSLILVLDDWSSITIDLSAFFSASVSLSLSFSLYIYI